MMRDQTAPRVEPIQRRELGPGTLEDLAERFRMRLPHKGDEAEKAGRVRTAFEGFAGGVLALMPREGREAQLFLEALEVALFWATKGLFVENPLNPPLAGETSSGGGPPSQGRPPFSSGVVDGGRLERVEGGSSEPTRASSLAGVTVEQMEQALELLRNAKAGREAPGRTGEPPPPAEGNDAPLQG